MKKILLVLTPICSPCLLGACGGSGNSLYTSVATNLSVTPATSVPTGGTAFNFIVSALDASNRAAANHAGMVHFTNSDSNAIHPPNSALTSGKRTSR
jgi:hypothetical protein